MNPFELDAKLKHIAESTDGPVSTYLFRSLVAGALLEILALLREIAKK